MSNPMTDLDLAAWLRAEAQAFDDEAHNLRSNLHDGDEVWEIAAQRADRQKEVCRQAAERLEALEKQLLETQTLCIERGNDLIAKNNAIIAAGQREAELREALEFYTGVWSRDFHTGVVSPPRELTQDLGDKARAALRKDPA
jgi:chromosome segregation ATPase